MSGTFFGYMIGYIIVTVGVGYALYAAGVSSEWITASVLILIGLGIVYAISRSQADKARSETRKSERHYSSHPGSSSGRDV